MRVLARLGFACALTVHLVVIYAPQAPHAPSGFPVDKVVHALVFACVLWAGRAAGLPRSALAIALALHAPVSEVLQATLLPDRSGDPWDIAADWLGVALGLVIPWRRHGPP